MQSWRQAFREQSLARQLLLQLSALVFLMLLMLAGMAYLLVGRLVEQGVPPILQRSVELQATLQGQTFKSAQISVERLAKEWQRRIDQPSDAEIERRFAQLFERQADGVWRIQAPWIDTLRAPTFYLQHGSQGPDASVRRRAVVSHALLSEQGPALVPPYFSVYTDFVEKGLMVFSLGIDWGKSASSATDNFNYPTMTGSDPARNPERRSFWTPVYYDGEAKAWMVSVIQPLDWRGHWVGTMGHDITIDTLLQQIAETKAPLASVSMIFSRDGHLIAHPELRERIAAAQGQLALGDLKDPVLSSVHQLIKSAPSEQRSARTPDGRYLLVWSRIDGPDWWSVQLLPQAAINALLERLVGALLTVGAITLILTLLLLKALIRQRLQRPLNAITASTEALAAHLLSGAEPQALPPQASRDLRRLNQAFDSMATELAVHRRQEQAALLALEGEVQERRHAEEAVRLLNLSLEARVRERGDALQQAQNELVQRETLASLGSLVAGVSHELNTPIGNALIAADTASSALQEAQQQLAGGTVKRSELLSRIALAEQSLELCLGNLRRSAGLVRDFKQVAIDRASLQRRPFELRKVSEEVVHLLHFALKTGQHEVLIDLPEDLSLDGYPGAFGQVLTNLVQNAVLHGFDERTGGRIEIKLKSADAQSVVITVSDNGCGIPPAHLDQVFKPFFTTRFGKGGSGLGLHLVYNLVRNVLGGQIELHSEQGKGTCLTLTLPRHAPVDSGPSKVNG
ncbi:sensor histidine kinase [Paucibacter sp. DJ1R-11]|uniref:sensor histidine kinase n=1 Tax=Paucibacter sp. DJ1R-11 TaxID=2893556 RepID=UPI0021E4B925|nr:sensor histidine kinase [Paucibacter sp. DJ1R-11]MCV2362743.1 sensor histidine kinase [Paucibacter sp. DJ1R-11]